MIAVALVAIGNDFHAGTETQWLVSGLYLATAISAPTAGRLADLLGARRVFLTGLALVAVVSALAPLAPSLGWLIAARVLLGIGTGAQFPSGVAMIRRIADRRKASAVGALGLLVGLRADLGRARPECRRIPGRRVRLAGDLPGQPARSPRSPALRPAPRPGRSAPPGR